MNRPFCWIIFCLSWWALLKRFIFSKLALIYFLNIYLKKQENIFWVFLLIFDCSFTLYPSTFILSKFFFINFIKIPFNKLTPGSTLTFNNLMLCDNRYKAVALLTLAKRTRVSATFLIVFYSAFVGAKYHFQKAEPIIFFLCILKALFILSFIE